MANDEKSNVRTPGPFWMWLIAAVVLSQFVKRGIVGWPLPKDFDFGSRFVDNFLANMIYGLPVLVVYLLILAVLNIGRNSGDSDQGQDSHENEFT